MMALSLYLEVFMKKSFCPAGLEILLLHGAFFRGDYHSISWIKSNASRRIHCLSSYHKNSYLIATSLKPSS
jgi:hypothetical protein